MSISKRTETQITEKLQSLLKIGESRHNAKKEGIANQYIYSWNTYHTYKREIEHFASWCNELNVNNVYRMIEHVPTYIEYLINDNRPATSVVTALSALKKFYNDEFKEIKSPSVKRENITRGRFPSVYSQKFSEDKNEELVNFLKSTGLRRHELQQLKGGSIKEENGQYYVIVKSGKGGKYRESPILNNDIRVIERIKNTPSNYLVWGKVSKHCNIHKYRADYATSIYELHSRDIETIPLEERYYCRGDRKGAVYDKQAMAEASQALGHNRINVIASHYLYI